MKSQSKFDGHLYEHRYPSPTGRRVLAYVPNGAPSSTAGLMVIPSSGVTIEQAIEQSGWIDIADSKPDRLKFIVVFCEASTVWDLKQPQADLDYMQEALAFFNSRWNFCIHESKRYLVGYGDGGTIASVAAASDPASWAGLATIDALPVHGGLSDTCAELCVNLQGYENDGSVDLVKGDIGLPYWAIGGTTDDLDTWLIRNGCDSSPFRVDDETDEFRRTTNVRSLLNEDADAFVVRRTDTSGYSKNQGSEINARLWDEFLSRHQRWMSLPGGDLRIAADPVKDLGMEYHDDYIDGWRREWYLHVPDQVKESSVPAPLVVALHGYTCTGEIYVGNSGWSRVADEYGFIVAFPTALAGNVDMKNDAIQPDFHPMPAWNIASNVPNGPDDVSFIEQIISQTAERWPVDESRIYATGHSWGSVMTHLLAAAIPDRFAAVAPCSGICFGGSLKNIGEQAAYNPPPLPIWMLWGTKEEWLISPLPKRGTETDETIRWWAHRNGVNPPDDLVSVMSPADVDIIGRTWWQNELENDYPVVRYTAVDGMPHATMPSMSRRIWTDFFSRIRRGKNGEITEI